MIANIAADLIVLVHFIFIVFVGLGGLLAIRWWRISFIHIPCVLWGSLIELRGWICPLTPLEQHFRELAGGSGYSGGFIEHYVMPLIYPESLTREMQISIGILVLVFNLCLYGFVIVKHVKGND